jgi:hypothetical protein
VVEGAEGMRNNRISYKRTAVIPRIVTDNYIIDAIDKELTTKGDTPDRIETPGPRKMYAHSNFANFYNRFGQVLFEIQVSLTDDGT